MNKVLINHHNCRVNEYFIFVLALMLEVWFCNYKYNGKPFAANETDYAPIADRIIPRVGMGRVQITFIVMETKMLQKHCKSIHHSC